MDRQLLIRDIFAREILDSRGNPTIEAEVLTEEEVIGRASVPSGASTGRFQAVELRDREERYHGRGVETAVENVNSQIAHAVIGMNVFGQEEIDRALIRADGRADKGNMGANALLSVSMAAARAAAAAVKTPLYRYLGGVRAVKMPVPMMNILNGGVHADNTLDIQEFMIVPAGEKLSFREQLRICTEVYQSLREVLKERGFPTTVGDEGGFAPDLKNTHEALRMIREAVEYSGYRLGRDIRIALDVAASELYDQERQVYIFRGEGQEQEVTRTMEEMIEYYEELISEFPICSIEDPLDQEDWKGWQVLTERIGGRVQLVGDALFVTNAERLKKGIRLGAANAVLIKVNQSGTLTEAFEAIKTAQDAGYRTIISHRSGETEDTFIADIAVAFNTGQIKAGAPCRSERVAKYNRLLRIEEQLGEPSREIH